MTDEELHDLTVRREAHAEAHQSLDWLIGQFKLYTGRSLNTSIGDLLAWSHQQTIAPDRHQITIKERLAKRQAQAEGELREQDRTFLNEGY